MKKNKNQKSLLLLLLLLAISVGYALIATTLKINGSSNVKSARWNVYWDNVQIKSGSVETTEENKAQIVDQDKTIVEYTVELTEPGDFYEFTVDAVNDGSLDAMIETITDNGLTAAQKEYINYSVKYSDGTTVTAKDKLTAHTRETYKVRLEYRTDIDSSKLPEGNQTLDLSFEIRYIQANNTAVARPRSCNEYLYAEGNITNSQYNTICGEYIDESIFTYEDNGDGTLTLTGLQSGVTLNSKVFALPTSIDGKTVTEVGEGAFGNKIMSQILIISPTITRIGDMKKVDEVYYGAFSNNEIKDVAMPNSVTYIGNGAFSSDSNIESIKISNGVEKILPTTFAGCSSLSKVVLNDNITEIGDNAFVSCNISSIDFPKNLTKIGMAAFANNKIKKIVLPDKLTTLSNAAFANNPVEELYTGNGITRLDYGVFNFYKLKKIVIGDSVTEILNSYFQNADGAPELSEVVIGKNVTRIGYSAFNSTNLTVVTIPKNVTEINSDAFANCNNITKVINKTGKAFDWYNILGVSAVHEYEQTFVTGTVEGADRTIQITAE